MRSGNIDILVAPGSFAIAAPGLALWRRERAKGGCAKLANIRRMGDERDENTAAARISEQERRDFASSRRRQWVTSSRRFIEARKSAPPKTAAEREEIRNRLYSARRKIAPRVYA